VGGGGVVMKLDYATLPVAAVDMFIVQGVSKIALQL
jgi:hypothetical protein